MLKKTEIKILISCLLRAAKPPFIMPNLDTAMKKPFALFCALCLMPTFSAQAWVGGPFSNNTFFGESGADGIYEASASSINGLGLFRITVGNAFQGIAAAQNSGNPITPNGTAGRAIDYDGIRSGNAVFGAYGSIWSNLWFVEGISYRGRTLGTANPAIGLVAGFAEAYSTRVVQPIEIDQDPLPDIPQNLTPVSTISSAFKARFERGGSKIIAGQPFRGVGRGNIVLADGTVSRTFRFSVFGSKVSDQIFVGL